MSKNSMYGFTDDHIDPLRVAFPVSACVDNVELTGCEYVSEGNWEAIDFILTRETSNGTSVLKDRMFAINPKNLSANPHIPGDTAEEALKRESKKFNTRLRHIAHRFDVSDEALSTCVQAMTSTDDFQSFAEAYCELIMQNCKGVKLYCKTVRNADGYTKLAKYPPFLQCMSEGDCELTYTKSELNMIENSEAPNGVSSTSEVPVVSQEDWVV